MVIERLWNRLEKTIQPGERGQTLAEIGVLLAFVVLGIAATLIAGFWTEIMNSF